MSFIELLFLAVGLAMDCFAVSFSAGAVQKDFKMKSILLMAFSFGLFQAMMPVIGWFGGELVVARMAELDHWIAFSILGFIGGKMINDAIRPQKEESGTDMTRLGTILILSVATSIDALAVGFSFSILKNIDIWHSALIIGLVSFLLTIVGVTAGKNISRLFKPAYAQITGGIILVSIGVKILIEHLS